MKKLNDLRDYLMQRVPSLKRDPDRLLTFVEDGRIIFHPGNNYSHQYRLPARIIVTDWAGNVDDIVLPLLEWISVREPGFNPEEILRFESEILDKEKVDLAFTVQLTERVVVTFQEGQRTITHILPEPAMQMNADASWELTTSGPDGTRTVPDDGA
ncbi:phage tail protein [Marinimicrobium sp. ARAG 43.8]|uniref:phage tail protein n=1 Tax=Marinimicrobium sp. ARAG 43.8 TaxID=3418719 RepID=UPI003CE8C65E